MPLILLQQLMLLLLLLLQPLQKSTALAARTPTRPRRWFAKLLAVVSLLLLLAGDVNMNPGPSCYVCVNPSPPSHLSHARLPNSNPQANPLQRCAPLTKVSTVELPKPRRARATSYHSNTRRLLQLSPPFPTRHKASRMRAQDCTNLAQATKRCSRVTATPDQWRCIHHCTSSCHYHVMS